MKRLPELYSKFDGAVVNTRFNPTVNGDLHLGHLYLCLVNEYEAHRTGGRFGVRFDDSKPCTMEWASSDKDKIALYRHRQLADIEQFVTVDYHESELDSKWRLCQMPKKLTEKWMISAPHPYPESIRYPAEHHTGAGEYYPYVPGWTAEKVWLDALAGVNWLIRGEDLISEFALYIYFCDVIGLPLVRQTYVPRLQPKGKRFDSVSKTAGGYSIRSAVARYGKGGVLDILRESCLSDPAGPFTVYNIKQNPVLVI